MKESQPLVSCICLTHNSVDLLQRALRCFQKQTYGSKELIVAFTDDNKSAAGLINRLGDASVRPLVYSSETNMTLGEKRNAAIQHASGQYICNWDDDDWHHIERIEIQAKALFETENKASILSQLILYDGVSGDSYISATRWGWEQTLFCEKSLFDNPDWKYQHADRGEDSPLIYKLKQSNLLVSIPRPDLYVYVYHSRNVFHREHWDVNLLPWAEKLSSDRAAVVREMLEEAAKE
jgi:glycosyltransferase involved in cell wall biosynthesis